MMVVAAAAIGAVVAMAEVAAHEDVLASRVAGMVQVAMKEGARTCMVAKVVREVALMAVMEAAVVMAVEATAMVAEAVVATGVVEMVKAAAVAGRTVVKWKLEVPATAL